MFVFFLPANLLHQMGILGHLRGRKDKSGVCGCISGLEATNRLNVTGVSHDGCELGQLLERGHGLVLFILGCKNN
jgi:hypothetical protein